MNKMNPYVIVPATTPEDIPIPVPLEGEKRVAAKMKITKIMKIIANEVMKAIGYLFITINCLMICARNVDKVCRRFGCASPKVPGRKGVELFFTCACSDDTNNHTS